MTRRLHLPEEVTRDADIDPEHDMTALDRHHEMSPGPADIYDPETKVWVFVRQINGRTRVTSGTVTAWFDDHEEASSFADRWARLGFYPVPRPRSQRRSA